MFVPNNINILGIGRWECKSYDNPQRFECEYWEYSTCWLSNTTVVKSYKYIDKSVCIFLLRET